MGRYDFNIPDINNLGAVAKSLSEASDHIFMTRLKTRKQDTLKEKSLPVLKKLRNYHKCFRDDLDEIADNYQGKKGCTHPNYEKAVIYSDAIREDIQRNIQKKSQEERN